MYQSLGNSFLNEIRNHACYIHADYLSQIDATFIELTLRISDDSFCHHVLLDEFVLNCRDNVFVPLTGVHQNSRAVFVILLVERGNN